MEGLGVTLDAYRGRRVLVTGHTGFKGSWLTLWLDMIGAQVAGIALPPEEHPNHWDLLALDIETHIVDLRDSKAVRAIVQALRPEIVFHLAAQSLVRRSYASPLETWSTNVLGTANLLDACRGAPDTRGVVVVTSDKCYENLEVTRGYRETDPLGGHDPYSASKAATELVASSYRSAFFESESSPIVATARAGNVIGGGDWSIDRLIPDLMRAIAAGAVLEIRSPNATRPWQHVLESLCGYLLLGERLLRGDRSFGQPWNFGPDPAANRTVSDVLTTMQRHWPDLEWRVSEAPTPHEATLLHLDSTKARQLLQWRPVWDFEQAVATTAKWYADFFGAGVGTSREQLRTYMQILEGRTG